MSNKYYGRFCFINKTFGTTWIRDNGFKIMTSRKSMLLFINQCFGTLNLLNRTDNFDSFFLYFRRIEDDILYIDFRNPIYKPGTIAFQNENDSNNSRTNLLPPLDFSIYYKKDGTEGTIDECYQEIIRKMDEQLEIFNKKKLATKMAIDHLPPFMEKEIAKYLFGKKTKSKRKYKYN